MNSISKKCEDLSDILDDTLIINGDGRNVDLLEQEGITQMDAFVAVTGNSETNILSCLLAKKMGVKKTIAEVENMEYINLAENTGIDTIINKKISAASRIFRHTTNPNVTQVKYMTGTDAEVLEFNVPANAKITRGHPPEPRLSKGCNCWRRYKGWSTIYCDTVIPLLMQMIKLWFSRCLQPTKRYRNSLSDIL